jgi:hypothetical protein
MLRQLPSALGVADRSYCLIQKNAAHPCHSQSHSTQIRATTHRSPCAPATRQPHRDSDALASAHAHHPAACRASARPLAAPWPPPRLLCCSLCHPGHCALAAARRPPRPRICRPGRRLSSGLRFGHRSPVLRHPRHQARPDSNTPASDPRPPRCDSDAPAGAHPPPCPDAISRSSSTLGR